MPSDSKPCPCEGTGGRSLSPVEGLWLERVAGAVYIEDSIYVRLVRNTHSSTRWVISSYWCDGRRLIKLI